MRSDPFAIKDSFLSKESPFANIDAELEKLKQDSLKNASLNPYKDVSLTSTLERPSLSNMTSGNLRSSIAATTIDNMYRS